MAVDWVTGESPSHRIGDRGFVITGSCLKGPIETEARYRDLSVLLHVKRLN